MPPPAGLVSWWPGELDVLDYGSTNHGVVTGGVTFQVGQVEQAFALDGTSGFIRVAAAPNLDPIQEATLEVWVKLEKLPSSAGHDMSIIAKSKSGNNFDLQADRDDRFRFYLGSAAVASSTRVETGTWYHVAATYAAKSNIRIWVNGVPEGTTSLSFSRTANGTALQIGASAVWAGRYFSGLIDEPAVYSRALTAPELADIYNAGVMGKCRSPSITLQPQSLLVPAGKMAGFSVSACGSPPLNYQWFLKGLRLIDDETTRGSQTAAVTISGAQYTNGGLYELVASNSLGTCTSAPVILTVFAPTPVAWADWSSAVIANPAGSAMGTLSSGCLMTEVSYSGEVFHTTQTNTTGVNYFTPLSTYTNSAVTNPPVNEMITFVGGSTTNTLRFSPPVPYPLLALVSLGSPGKNVDLSFDAPFEILTSGAGWWGSGAPLTQSSNTLHGAESDGLIRFNGTFSSISWTVSPGDTFYNGFTVGVLGSLLAGLKIESAQDGSAVLHWANPEATAHAFSLQAAGNVAGPYTNIEGAMHPYTNTIKGGQIFFRLKAN